MTKDKITDEYIKAVQKRRCEIFSVNLDLL